MDADDIKSSVPTTPAYVFDEKIINQQLETLLALKKTSGCHVLYSLKALPLARVLHKAVNCLDGLSASSLFEVRLAHQATSKQGSSLHITTPGLRSSEFDELNTRCTHMSFNSLSQYQRFTQAQLTTSSSLGLRINPKISFATDPRFNPCRPYSKLGVDIEQLSHIPKGIDGLHFHTVFSHTDYLSLKQTINVLVDKFGQQLSQLKWLNLGGGYLYHQIANQQPFIDLIHDLTTAFSLNVYFEPGKAVVNEAGYLVSTVIDRLYSDGKEVLILDTSVNHHPEVFEYQRRLDLVGESEQGGYRCILAGSSCLAGDVFGEYQLDKPLRVGDSVVFKHVGAYSMIKANYFNGYNLPDMYWCDATNQLSLIHHHVYDDYQKQWSK
ncbi:MAG: carboxynorspermidine decarboxylase [Methylococcales bacterium]|nr:carboxynorspermidine decarboxylase [Methylococcales bacterium]